MLNRKAQWLSVTVVVLLGCLMGACAGGSTTVVPHFQDPGINPGVVGDVDGTASTVLDRIQPYIYQPAGISADAPLGTNPAYDVQPASAVVATHTSAKAGSELDGGSNLRDPGRDDWPAGRGAELGRHQPGFQ